MTCVTFPAGRSATRSFRSSCSRLLTLLGLVTFMRMDVNNNPGHQLPGGHGRRSVQPGAAPSELETQVTQRVEAAIRGINGVDEIQSTAREGAELDLRPVRHRHAVDRAVNDVRDAIANIRSDLPDGILEPQVEREEADGGPIAYMAVESTAMTARAAQLVYRQHDQQAPARHSRHGQRVARRRRQPRDPVILDPARMQANGITAAQVNSPAARRPTINAAGGRAEIAGSEQSVRVLGNAERRAARRDARSPVGNGRTVRLSRSPTSATSMPSSARRA
jgi:multidrug efflux pump subunit AcrB